MNNLALVNNSAMAKKFLIVKFDCRTCWNSIILLYDLTRRNLDSLEFIVLQGHTSSVDRLSENFDHKAEL